MSYVQPERSVFRLPALLTELRQQRRISLRQLADSAGVSPSVASRAARGADARLSTWVKLFEGLGYRLLVDTTELAEETADLLEEEADRRQDRRREGLCAGKRRFY